MRVENSWTCESLEDDPLRSRPLSFLSFFSGFLVVVPPIAFSFSFFGDPCDKRVFVRTGEEGKMYTSSPSSRSAFMSSPFLLLLFCDSAGSEPSTGGSIGDPAASFRSEWLTFIPSSLCSWIRNSRRSSTWPRRTSPSSIEGSPPLLIQILP